MSVLDPRLWIFVKDYRDMEDAKGTSGDMEAGA